MIPIIDRKCGKDIYEQIYLFYKNGILQNKFKKGDKLLSIRKLATELQISNTTLIKSYERLTDEGYLINIPKKGFYVSEIEIDFIKNNEQVTKTDIKSRKSIIHNFQNSLVDENLFPIRQWRKMQQLAFDNLNFRYYNVFDDNTLKPELLKYLLYSRGINANEDQVYFGAGMDVLLSVLALMLNKTHSNLIIENPSYYKVKNIFEKNNFKIKPIAIKSSGIDVKQLEFEKADLLFLTPSHQFPTGLTISIADRIKILKWAKLNSAYIIEDDYDCEFRHKSSLIPSLFSIDKYDSVIYTGTFSHTIMPSIRIAYLILPKNFKIDISEYSFLLNTVPQVSLKTLSNFIENGYWNSHIKKLKKLNREKYYLCVKEFQTVFKEKISFQTTHSGMNILITVITNENEDFLIKKAKENNIIVNGASKMYFNKIDLPNCPQFLFAFGGFTLKEIPKVIRLLYSSWF